MKKSVVMKIAAAAMGAVITFGTALPVCASSSSSGTFEYNGHSYLYNGDGESYSFTDGGSGETIFASDPEYDALMKAAGLSSSSGSDSSDSKDDHGKTRKRIEAKRAAERLAIYVRNEGYDDEDYYMAASQGLRPTEYKNNVVIDYGTLLDKAVAVSQDGGVQIGDRTVTLTVQKVDENTLAEAESIAAKAGGKLMNVVKTTSVQVPKFDKATVPFAVKGVTADSNIKVYKLVNGAKCEWEEVKSTVTDGHVNVEMDGHATLAFVQF